MMQKLREVAGPLSSVWNHKLFTIAGVKISTGNLLVALILLLFAARLARLITKFIDHRLITKFVEDKSSQITYQTFAFYASLAAVVAMSLTIAGIPLTVFTVVGGALAIGVGFGSQNIVNNFISGMIILVERPIKVGDIVEVEGNIGSIQSIGTRSTKIKNGDNKIFIVPNSFFLEKTVLNWTYEQQIIRNTVTFGVAYGTDVKLVENISLDILLNNPDILQSPMPKVLFEGFGDSNLNFQLFFHCDLTKISTLAEVRSAVRFAIDEKFKQHKIEMAFPQRDMKIKFADSLDLKMLT